MTTAKIKSVSFINVEDIPNREVHATLTDGTIVKITACCESYEQYGATVEDYARTVALAQACIGYLQGAEPNTLSYAELANAEECFEQDLDFHSEDEETTENARIEFTSRIGAFEDWIF